MIKLADYIAKFVADQNVRHVFMITGGGAMHLNDAFGCEKRIQCVFNHHEQSSAFAAEGYYRASGRMAVVNVTSGPGGTNTVTGVIGQWLDSIPALYVSGQVKQQTIIASCPELGLRQLGDQEINIVDIVRPITKYAVMVRDPLQIRYHLEKAFFLALHGRPGPVWLDIPLDVQAALIKEEDLLPFQPAAEEETVFDHECVDRQVGVLIEKLLSAKRPVIMAGHGIRISGAVDAFHQLIEKLHIPVVTAINAHDLIWSDHPLFFGRPGISGDRIGNVVVQNSDFFLSIGARLGVRQISYNYASFAREAFRAMVDIDPAELKKPTLNLDLPIQSDAGYFIDELSRQLELVSLPAYQEWIKWCSERKAALPTLLQDNTCQPQYVNFFKFEEELSSQLSGNSVVVTGNGTAYTGTFQAVKIKRGMRLFSNQGCASMGFDIPAAVGACFGLRKSPIVLITGDGSIQMNIQELQTIFAYRLPIKIFVLQNNGYLAIRITQDTYFEGRHVGSEPSGGLFLPDIKKIASAYGIAACEIRDDNQLAQGIRDVLAADGPMLCEIVMDPHQTLYPKLSSVVKEDGSMVSCPLEDMYPFLSREEFLENMIIPPVKS